MCMSPSMIYLLKQFKVVLSSQLILSSIMTLPGPLISPDLTSFSRYHHTIKTPKKFLKSSIIQSVDILLYYTLLSIKC